ncbi:hypothetical protein Tco_1051419 [Tanacetum coccineum]
MHTTKTSPAFTNNPPDKPSFAFVVHGSSSTVDSSISNKIRTISLKEQDLVSIDDSSMVLLVKLKDVDSMSNMYLHGKSLRDHQEKAIVEINPQTLEDDSKDNKIDSHEDANSVDDLDELLNDLNDDKGQNDDNNEPFNNNLKSQKVEGNNIQQPSSNESSSHDLSRPPGFENFKKETSSNSNCSTSFAKFRSGGLISLWDPNMFTKKDIWCDDSFVIVKGKWKILEAKANTFNNFISNYGLIELPMGSRLFTWMNKANNKLRKLDWFLLSDNVIEALPHAQVVALDRLCNVESNIATSEDRETRIKLLHYIDKIDSFEALDLQQKSHIKCDIEGDENSKFFHGFNGSVPFWVDLCSLDMDNIFRVLQVFYLASGLKINIHKSNVYRVGVSDNEVHSMANNIGCSPGFFPFIYLGLPIGANMNLTTNWKTLLDKFDDRLSKWKVNLLSIGGRLTLIKTILGSLGIYYLSVATRYASGKIFRPIVPLYTFVIIGSFGLNKIRNALSRTVLKTISGPGTGLDSIWGLVILHISMRLSTKLALLSSLPNGMFVFGLLL